MCIGMSTDAEREVGRRLGVEDPVAFFALAQRVVWGLSQPDIVEVDVGAALEALVRNHDASFAAHLVAAAALRGTDPTRAEQALERATELSGDDPLALSLLPSAATWAGEVPEQKLVEVIDDAVWRIRKDFLAVGVPFTNASVATLVRIDEDSLALINPVELEPDVLTKIASLGTVRWLITQGPGHSRYIEGSTKAFPEATNWGITGHLEHPSAANVRFDGMLDQDARKLPAALGVFMVGGSQLPEALVLHRPTSLLVIQDLVAHNANNPMRPFFSRLYSVAFGVVDRVGFHAFQPMAWSNLRMLHRDVDRVVESDFERVTAAHWPLAPQSPTALRKTLGWLRTLSPLAHKALLARYFWAQPRFMRDLVRFTVRRRRKGRQAARA